MATEEEMASVVKAWLHTKHGTLWSQAFDIGPEGRIDTAAAWFARQMAEFTEWVGESVSDSEPVR